MDGSAKSLIRRKALLIGVNLRMMEEKPSGIQNYITGLFKELIKKENLEFFFFSTGNNKLQGSAHHFKPNSGLINFLKKIDTRLANIFFDNFYILKFIKKYKVNIFISPSFILPFIKPKGIKYLAVIHDLSFLKYPHNPFKIYMNLVMYMKILMPFTIKKADLIAVDSIFTKKELERVYRVESKKIQVIYPGRDNFFHPNRNETALGELINKYHMQKKYIFTTATNHERKNIFGLIDAFRQIKLYNDYQLIICGLLPDFTIAKLDEYLKELNLTKKVKFLGFVSKEELRLLYSRAKIFVFPSFEEGFGLPVLESVSCGCLPICSNAGALPEVIGNKDLLFNPRETLSIAHKIDEVLSWSQGKYTSCLQKEKEYMSKFSWQKAVNQYLELFK